MSAQHSRGHVCSAIFLPLHQIISVRRPKHRGTFLHRADQMQRDGGREGASEEEKADARMMRGGSSDR